MRCIMFLRKSPKAGERCPNKAKNGAYCALHNPAIVLPRLQSKRRRILGELNLVDEAIKAAEFCQEQFCNPT